MLKVFSMRNDFGINGAVVVDVYVRNVRRRPGQRVNLPIMCFNCA